jgi:hypothetical protein
LVDFQAVLVLAALGIMIPQDLESLYIARVPLHYSLEEADFNIQLSDFFAREPFALGTAFTRHTTGSIVSKRTIKVKKAGCRVRLKVPVRILNFEIVLLERVYK